MLWGILENAAYRSAVALMLDGMNVLSSVCRIKFPVVFSAGRIDALAK